MGYFQKFLVILMCLYNFIDSNVCIVIRRICFIQLEQNIAYVQPDFSEIIADIYIFFLFFFFWSYMFLLFKLNEIEGLNI